ncbi:MAG: hemolysin family protein [Treponema sp.]|nr:hemolysin family protein [Treponema sp.]
MNPKSLIKSFLKREKEGKTYESLETQEKEMIQGVLELSDTTVKEVMVPRIDTIFISVDIEREELLSRIIESGHSRFPVFEDTIDKVIGILYVKDVLKSLVLNEPIDLISLSRKPYFVPESKRINDLLKELRHRKVQIAVVVDEYGGVSGIVSMENIIEEIIGDIQDEFDDEKEDILDLGSGSWLCDTRVNLEDLGEHIGIKLPSEDFDTLGGFVFDLFGKIPVKYEKQVWEGHEFIVQDVEGHKINSVKIILAGKDV